MVCGVVGVNYKTQIVMNAALMQYPDFVGEFVYTTSEVARSVPGNPAANGSCTTYYYQSSSVVTRLLRPVLVMPVLLGVAFMVV